MVQLGLLDAPARSRRDSPASSKAASKRVGPLLRGQRLEAYTLVCAKPYARTAEEMAGGDFKLLTMLRRRLGEVVAMGLIERIEKKGCDYLYRAVHP